VNDLAYLSDREDAPRFSVAEGHEDIAIKNIDNALLKSIAEEKGINASANMDDTIYDYPSLGELGVNTSEKDFKRKLIQDRENNFLHYHPANTEKRCSNLFAENSWINLTLKAFLDANPFVKYITVFTMEHGVEIEEGQENYINGDQCNLLAIDIDKYKDLFTDTVIQAEGKDKTDEIVSHVRNALFGLDCPILIEPHMTGMKLPFIPKEYWSDDQVDSGYRIKLNGDDDREIDIEAYMALNNQAMIMNRSSEYAMLLDDDYRFIAYTLDHGVLSEMAPIVQQVTGMMHFNLSTKLAHWDSWTIDIRKSILSKLEATEVSLPKEVFLKSKMLRDGVHFIFTRNVKNYPKQHIHIWLDESDTLVITQNLSNTNEINPTIALHPFYFSMKNLPDKITEKSMKKVLEMEQSIFQNDVSDDGLLTKEDEEKGLVYEAWLSYQATNRGFNFVHSNGKRQDIATVSPPNTGNPDEKFAEEFSKIVWDSLKLLVAYSSPELRNQIRKVKGERTLKDQRTGEKGIVTYRKWVWGTNKEVYLYPKKRGKKSKGTWYSRPSLAKYYIKNTQKYLDLGYDIEDEEEPVNGRNHSVILWREGSWKGNKDKFYFAGNVSGPYSLKAIAWLKRIEREQGLTLEHAERNQEFRIDLGNGNYYLADGYCKENNTIYEFNGDFWHGNPAKYESEDINPKNGKTFGELYMKTVVKENVLKSMGFNVVSIWETEFDKEVRR
tara:strand:+ start:2157 stop:4322 length:2166 start_codon:yes stop_codon:yes gene_type:complete